MRTVATQLATSARVLVVDDEVELMTVLCEMLAEHGYETVGCASAQEALAVLREQEIDLLITDLMMPGMDGITLLRLAQEAHPYLIGIVATGQGTIQTAVDAMKSGAFDYVLKPFKLSALLPTLERAADVGRLKRDNVHLRETIALRDEFISVAAHELKTPITSLLGAVQLLIRQQEREATLAPDQIVRSLQIVERQAGRMSRLVTQLLETSRLDSGRFVPQRSLVDVTSLVTAAVEQARHATDRHEIVLSAPASVPAHVDATRIEQVVGNLLDNAIKFSPDGGRIDVEVSTPCDETIRVAVRDHGIGIPPPRRQELFTRYYQAHAESHRSGLGLGLYISRCIVEHHGGKIGVEFPADVGSRFIVDLPAGANGVGAALARQQQQGTA